MTVRVGEKYSHEIKQTGNSDIFTIPPVLTAFSVLADDISYFTIIIIIIYLLEKMTFKTNKYNEDRTEQDSDANYIALTAAEKHNHRNKLIT